MEILLPRPRRFFFFVQGAGPAECSDRYTNNSPICPGLEARDNHKSAFFDLKGWLDIRISLFNTIYDATARSKIGKIGDKR
jgi:hypothetical protein